MDNSINANHIASESVTAFANGTSPGETNGQRTYSASSGQPVKLWTLDELEELAALDWLVDGILPAERLALIFGPAGVYKTFLALDIALSVATSLPCLGRKTKQGPVVYISGEGQAALGKRTRAWSRARGATIDPDMFRVVTVPLQFHQEEAPAVLLASLQDLPQPPKLIIVDTLARCFVGGDENDSRDMGLFIAGVDAICQETGATILVIHHTSASTSSARPRGHSALEGAMDTVLQVKKTPKKADHITITNRKQKDEEGSPDIECPLQKVDIGDGNTSLVLGSAAGPGTKVPTQDTAEYQKQLEFAQLVREMGNPYLVDIQEKLERLHGRSKSSVDRDARKAEQLGLIRIVKEKYEKTTRNRLMAVN